MSRKNNDILKLKNSVSQNKEHVLTTHDLQQETAQNIFLENESFTMWCGFSWRSYTVSQAPQYPCPEKLFETEKKLQTMDTIAEYNEISSLIDALYSVHQNDGFILQLGDCAETFHHSDVGYTTQRVSLFCELQRLIQESCQGPVIAMGRMAGQFAKPRSSMTETIDKVMVSSYFGDVVNSFELDEREPDPDRLIIGYQVAYDTMTTIRLFNHVWSQLESKSFCFGKNFFTCHESYLLPYEQNLLREIPSHLQKIFYSHTTPIEKKIEPFTIQNIEKSTTNTSFEAQVYSSSAHFLWVGERTRQVENAHIQLIKRIYNPVGVKIGPNATFQELEDLIITLNPDNIPGRLSFIFRLGLKNMHKLQEFAAYLKNKKLHRHVLWICDPMHGNTLKTSQGLKTRKTKDILEEITEFSRCLAENELPFSGVHLEITPHDVCECIDYDDQELSLHASCYLTTCDPRLNGNQAVRIIDYIAQLILNRRRII